MKLQNTMRLPWLAFSLAVLSACGSLQTSSEGDLDPPGWLDVGIGAAQLLNATKGDDNDASGFMASVKAYPVGRWYSTKKAQARLVVDPAKLPVDTTIKTTVGANGEKATTIAGANLSELESIVKTDKNFHERVFCLDKNDATTCRDQWYHRISVFAGISSDNFTGANLDSPVYSIGAGFDVSPGFALIAGIGWYDYQDAADGSRKDSDSAFLFGFQLNLKAFEGLWKGVN